MMLCHYLTPQTIVIAPDEVQKEVFLDSLLDRLCEVWHLKDRALIGQAVWSREKEGRTVLENGLALPHARIQGLEEIKACLGVLPQGYPDALEGTRVHLVFLFLSPQDQFENHLQMLAKISRLFQDPAFVSKLLSVSDPEEAFQLIQRQERA